jgi:hypothetical protein
MKTLLCVLLLSAPIAAQVAPDATLLSGGPITVSEYKLPAGYRSGSFHGSRNGTLGTSLPPRKSWKFNARALSFAPWQPCHMWKDCRTGRTL